MPEKGLAILSADTLSGSDYNYVYCHLGAQQLSDCSSFLY